MRLSAATIAYFAVADGFEVADDQITSLLQHKTVHHHEVSPQQHASGYYQRQLQKPGKPGAAEFIGCFVDDPSRNLEPNPDSGISWTADNTNTFDKCRSACGDSTYISLQYGGECFCGDSYGGGGCTRDDLGCENDQYVQRPESECNDSKNAKCNEASYNCGGTWRNAVYQINEPKFTLQPGAKPAAQSVSAGAKPAGAPANTNGGPAKAPLSASCTDGEVAGVPVCAVDSDDGNANPWILFGDITDQSQNFVGSQVDASPTRSGLRKGDSVQIGTFTAGAVGSPGYSLDIGQFCAGGSCSAPFDLKIEYGDASVASQSENGYSTTNGGFINNAHTTEGVVVGEHGMFGEESPDGYFAVYCAYNGGCQANGNDFLQFSKHGIYPRNADEVPCGFHFTRDNNAAGRPWIQAWKDCSIGDNTPRMRYYIRSSDINVVRHSPYGQPVSAATGSINGVPVGTMKSLDSDGNSNPWILFGDISDQVTNFQQSQVTNSPTTSGAKSNSNGDSVQIGTFTTGAVGSPGYSLDVGQFCAGGSCSAPFDLLIQYGDQSVYSYSLTGFSTTDGGFINNGDRLYQGSTVGEHGVWGSYDDSPSGYWATYCAVAGSCATRGNDYWQFSKNGVYPSSADKVPCGMYSYQSPKWKDCDQGDNGRRMRYYIRSADLQVV